MTSDEIRDTDAERTITFRATDVEAAEPLTALILGAAARHGADSEPDHEVGDLHDVLRIAIDLMTPAQRRQLFEQAFDTIVNGFPSFDAFDATDPAAVIEVAVSSSV